MPVLPITKSPNNTPTSSPPSSQEEDAVELRVPVVFFLPTTAGGTALFNDLAGELSNERAVDCFGLELPDPDPAKPAFTVKEQATLLFAEIEAEAEVKLLQRKQVILISYSGGVAWHNQLLMLMRSCREELDLVSIAISPTLKALWESDQEPAIAFNRLLLSTLQNTFENYSYRGDYPIVLKADTFKQLMYYPIAQQIDFLQEQHIVNYIEVSEKSSQPQLFILGVFRNLRAVCNEFFYSDTTAKHDLTIIAGDEVPYYGDLNNHPTPLKVISGTMHIDILDEAFGNVAELIIQSLNNESQLAEKRASTYPASYLFRREKSPFFQSRSEMMQRCVSAPSALSTGANTTGKGGGK